MKRRIANFFLGFAFGGCLAWGALTDGMVALIPLILAVFLGIAIVDYNTDYVRRY